MMLQNGAANMPMTHRHQNSSPMDMNSTTMAPIVPTNNQSPNHRHSLNLGHARLPQDFNFDQNNCGKVSIDNNGLQIQQLQRAAQMPGASRPGHQYNQSFQTSFPRSFEAMQLETVRRQPINNHTANGATQPFDCPESKQIEQILGKSSSSNDMSLYPDMKPGNTIAQLVDEIGKLPSHDIKQVVEELGLWYGIAGAQEGNDQHGLVSENEKSLTAARNLAGGNHQGSLPMKRGISWQEPLKLERTASADRAIPSAPNSAPLRCTPTFEGAQFHPSNFMDITKLKDDLVAVDRSQSSCHYSPMSNRSALSSFQSSPELEPISLFGTSASMENDMSSPSYEMSLFAPTTVSTENKRKGAGSRKDSQKQASDDELNFNPNDFLIESNITEEEINAHIQGPEENGKYVCLYENCKNPPFGRKENIRAHVQTHLDDRRYKCDACNNKFVRPNDLKRHWQIHINKRDFKCFCGAAFNRHDALKRHRERSEWCESGGTRGSPDSPKKDEKKRGRPKKIAPTESQERRERKAQIRREIRKKQEASTASSVASSQPSPPAFFDFEDCHATPVDADGLSPVHLLLSPPASPKRNVDEVFSPVTVHEYQRQRHSISPPPTRDSMISFGMGDTQSIDTFLLQESEPALALAGSSSIGNSSHQGSPPSLDLVSSSPPSRFLDFDFDSGPFYSNQGVDESVNKDNGEADQMHRWFFGQNDNETMSGIDPSKMHLFPTTDDQNEPMLW